MIKVEQDEVMAKGVGVAARVASHRDNDWLRWLVRFANIKEDEFMLTSINYDFNSIQESVIICSAAKSNCSNICSRDEPLPFRHSSAALNLPVPSGINDVCHVRSRIEAM